MRSAMQMPFAIEELQHGPTYLCIDAGLVADCKDLSNSLQIGRQPVVVLDPAAVGVEAVALHLEAAQSALGSLAGRQAGSCSSVY